MSPSPRQRRPRAPRSRPSPEAAQVLAQLPRLPDNLWVIPGAKSGARLSSLFEPWRRVRARAGLDDVRIHDLRHSYASRALALGESLPVIAKLLGHAQVQTTARYTHLTRDAVKDAAIRVARDIAEDLLEGHAPDRASASRGPGGATRIGIRRIAQSTARGHAVRGHRVKEAVRASAARIAADIGADILPTRQQGNIPAPSGSEADTTAHAA